MLKTLYRRGLERQGPRVFTAGRWRPPREDGTSLAEWTGESNTVRWKLLTTTGRTSLNHMLHHRDSFCTSRYNKKCDMKCSGHSAQSPRYFSGLFMALIKRWTWNVGYRCPEIKSTSVNGLWDRNVWIFHGHTMFLKLATGKKVKHPILWLPTAPYSNALPLLYHKEGTGRWTQNFSAGQGTAKKNPLRVDCFLSHITPCTLTDFKLTEDKGIQIWKCILRYPREKNLSTSKFLKHSTLHSRQQCASTIPSSG